MLAPILEKESPTLHLFLNFVLSFSSRPRESNPRPSLYESDALPTELGRRCDELLSWRGFNPSVQRHSVLIDELLPSPFDRHLMLGLPTQ